jgi:hypothetical protein
MIAAASLVGFARRRGLRLRGWLRRRLRIELRQRRAKRIEPRRMREPIVLYDATDCRSYRVELVVGEVNCRHGRDISWNQKLLAALGRAEIV